MSETIRLVSPEGLSDPWLRLHQDSSTARGSLQDHNWEASGWRCALGLTPSTQIEFALGVDADSEGAVRS